MPRATNPIARLWLRLAALVTSTAARPYADMDYDQMHDALHALAAEQPDFVRLFAAGDAFGRDIADVPGTCGIKHKKCEHYYLVVTDFASLPPAQQHAGKAGWEGAKDDPVEGRRPARNASSRAEVFLSGALHGDRPARKPCLQISIL